MLAGITPLRDISADPFLLSTISSSGWDVMRFTQFSLVETTGRRFWQRDKEGGFRPKIAGLNQEQVNYRNFLEEPSSGSEPPNTPTGGEGLTDVETPVDPPLVDVATESALSSTPTSQNRGTRKLVRAKASVGPGVIGPGNIVEVGITGSPVASGGGRSKRAGSYDVGYEMSLVGDIFGAIHRQPTWQPSNIHSANRSTMVLSRHELDDADKGDIDLAPRYFGRTHDLFSAVPTQKVELERVRFKGGNAHLKKTRSTEKYEDGIFKNALNITPIEKPIEGGIDQKTEEDNGPGEEGFALHPYLTGFPDPKVDEPDILHQGGWMFDARQTAVANLHDLIGIDAIKNEDAKLPRYTARFDWKVGIPYIRHDAHFLKVADKECPPPLGNGLRQSGRILFTDPFN